MYITKSTIVEISARSSEILWYAVVWYIFVMQYTLALHEVPHLLPSTYYSYFFPWSDGVCDVRSRSTQR